MFNIEFNRLTTWTLPTFLRRSVLLCYIRALCYPVKQLHDQFQNRRAADIYRVVHNSQVFSMEQVLNDRFDNQQRRIYITDGFTKDRIYIYTPIELKSMELGTIALYNSDDYSDTGVDFIIWVPEAVAFSDQDYYKMQAEADFYKLAGKRYRIYRV